MEEYRKNLPFAMEEKSKNLPLKIEELKSCFILASYTSSLHENPFLVTVLLEL
jgi:hypothetical protein